MGTTDVVGPELVVGIVRPVGTSDRKFRDALRAALHRYAYDARDIKLSNLLRDDAAARGAEINERDEEKRIANLMDEGDRLCEKHQTGSAVALLGVAEIRAQRTEANLAGGISERDAADAPAGRVAYILDSLKRPAEVTQLRRIYGDHFLVVSLQAALETRRNELKTKIGPRRPSTNRTIETIVDDLVTRDYREGGEFGQNTMRTFPMADVFVDLEANVTETVERVVDLLFDSPEYQPPSTAEFSMNLAHVTSTRSVEMGLKVGAALVAADGSVLGLGHNAHPDPQHQTVFDPSATDVVELVVDMLASLPPSALSAEVRSEFDRDRDRYASELLETSLKSTRLRDLIEFQRPVHAEMNALLAALRSRVDIAGATMYVTAYPCHHCARHLLALGLNVMYLEPYPKSRAEAMYGAAVQSFHPFVGVAPRRYTELFTVTGDRKDQSGARRTWGDAERSAAVPKIDPFVDPQGIADREISALEVLARPVPVAPDTTSEKLSHPRKRVSTAGTGKARSAPRTSARSSTPTSPKAPAPRKTDQGGRS